MHFRAHWRAACNHTFDTRASHRNSYTLQERGSHARRSLSERPATEDSASCSKLFIKAPRGASGDSGNGVARLNDGCLLDLLRRTLGWALLVWERLLLRRW